MATERTPILTPSRLFTSLSLSVDDYDNFQLAPPLHRPRMSTTFSLPNTPITRITIPRPATPLPKRPSSSPATTPPKQKRQKSLVNEGTAGHRSASSGSAASNQPTSSSPSTPTQQHPSAHAPSQLHAYTEHDDGQQNDGDPFAARPAYYEGGYHIRPLMTYYAIENKDAADEFENVIQEPIIQYLEQQRYAEFCVLCTHVGYEKPTAVPCVLVIAREFVLEDASTIIDLVDKLPRRYIHRAFCYAGRSSTQDSSLLKEHQTSPAMGSSIGVENGHSSFSVGIYLHLQDDDKRYCLSVHHGATKSTTPITPQTTPAIEIQQPSAPDHTDLLESLETTIRLIDEGAPRYRLRSRKGAERWLNETREKNTHFGIVKYSECEVVTLRGRDMNSDWCLIEVDQQRQPLQNSFRYITNDVTAWLPRDKGGNIYIQGVAELDVGNRVVKSGRSTGATEGEIELIYAHAHLDQDIPKTSEYTVVSGSQRRFSDCGDSGAPVIDESNKIVGIILGGTYGEPALLQGHEHLDFVYASYITPISLIISRIEMITGKKVIVDTVDIQAMKNEGMEFVGEEDSERE